MNDLQEQTADRPPTPPSTSYLTAEEEVERFKVLLAKGSTQAQRECSTFAVMFAIGHDMYKGAVQEWLQRRLQQEAKENDSLLASYDKIVQDAKTTSLPQVSEQQEEEEETATVTDPELPELEEGEIDDHPIQ